jgi:hypothetical protein
MWLLTTEGAYSAIRWYDGRICVRGRRRADLNRLRKIVPALSKVKVTPGSDYRYRCFCTVDEWADGMAALARTITYGNFKSEVARKRGIRDEYEHALHEIWSILSRLQPGGPYGGVEDRAGYPTVPKNERGLKVKARKLLGLAPTESLLDDVADAPTSSWLNDGSLVCDECGALLEDDEAINEGSFVSCRDVGRCIERTFGRAGSW